MVLATWGLEVARNLSSGVPRKAVHGTMSHQTQLEKDAGGSYCPKGPSSCHALEKLCAARIWCWRRCLLYKGWALRKPCELQETAERTQENQKAKPSLLQCHSNTLCWQSLKMCQLAKEKCLQGPDTFLHNKPWRMNFELRGNKLIHGTISSHTHIAYRIKTCQVPNSKTFSQVSS